ncbi:MAG: hypothetical protein QXG18_00605 [Candidatus Pacearchaeota archaeon]
MEKAQIWSVVGVALVVAVLASVVTATITGNAIRLNQDKYGRYQVYTKDEVYNKKEIDRKFLEVDKGSCDYVYSYMNPTIKDFLDKTPKDICNIVKKNYVPKAVGIFVVEEIFMSVNESVKPCSRENLIIENKNFFLIGKDGKEDMLFDTALREHIQDTDNNCITTRGRDYKVSSLRKKFPLSVLCCKE